MFILRQRFYLVLGLMLLLLVIEVKAFQFHDTDGKIHTLADYKGRWVIINFWATWCPPCLEEIPELIALYEDRKDIMVIGVAMEFSDPEVVMAFVEKMSISYPTVLGTRRIASQLDEISMLPSTYFFDPDGKPAARKLGIVTRESIESFINAR
ncbi:Thiol-disulfide isomerase or thioredoxin [Nitrosomonas aestuarii]|uniref:Thiol-disulfide isomerase or thioredoxin n=1 Tax=Nitrosomonas aestuarii TaxID=52441 RepID=A0A1I3YPW1_9PROT|nr:TlpA disulfide reductase family protein [Nitrosomonas aestuarii]SFK33810.1 Thiol-disulfide isomerase or thioredoxin [Nitrosomonas aestuarii]